MSCAPPDVACQVQQGIISLVTPYIIPALILLVALLILPRAGRKGWVLSLLVIAGVVLWYLGVPGTKYGPIGPCFSTNGCPNYGAAIPMPIIWLFWGRKKEGDDGVHSSLR